MMADLQNAERKAAKILDEIRAKEHQTETMGLSGFNQRTMSAWMQGKAICRRLNLAPTTRASWATLPT